MKVLFFAALRETMGQSELEILLEAPTTVAAPKSRRDFGRAAIRIAPIAESGIRTTTTWMTSE